MTLISWRISSITGQHADLVSPFPASDKSAACRPNPPTTWGGYSHDSMSTLTGPPPNFSYAHYLAQKGQLP